MAHLPDGLLMVTAPGEPLLSELRTVNPALDVAEITGTPALVPSTLVAKAAAASAGVAPRATEMG